MTIFAIARMAATSQGPRLVPARFWRELRRPISRRGPARVRSISAETEATRPSTSSCRASMTASAVRAQALQFCFFTGFLELAVKTKTQANLDLRYISALRRYMHNNRQATSYFFKFLYVCLPSSDCCDGSDEWNSHAQCQDTCAEDGKEALQGLRELLAGIGHVSCALLALFCASYYLLLFTFFDIP